MIVGGIVLIVMGLLSPPVSYVGTVPTTTEERPAATVAPVGAAGPPRRLLIPALEVAAAVEPVVVDVTGGLGVPADPAVVGWWAAGAGPGTPGGTVVVDGHVDTKREGPGALFRIAELTPGDAVGLVLADRTVSYEVRAVRHYVKADLPGEVFARDGAPRLVLVSCGGPFDRRAGRYRDNVVVYAVPVL
jgi:hypothetical protein